MLGCVIPRPGSLCGGHRGEITQPKLYTAWLSYVQHQAWYLSNFSLAGEDKGGSADWMERVMANVRNTASSERARAHSHSAAYSTPALQNISITTPLLSPIQTLSHSLTPTSIGLTVSCWVSTILSLSFVNRSTIKIISFLSELTIVCVKLRRQACGVEDGLVNNISGRGRRLYGNVEPLAHQEKVTTEYWLTAGCQKCTFHDKIFIPGVTLRHWVFPSIRPFSYSAQSPITFTRRICSFSWISSRNLAPRPMGVTQAPSQPSLPLILNC